MGEMDVSHLNVKKENQKDHLMVDMEEMEEMLLFKLQNIMIVLFFSVKHFFKQKMGYIYFLYCIIDIF